MVKRPPAGTIPDAPGSYQFKDAQGRVIYVGKAASLRQRLSNYFGDPRYMHPRTAQMVATAESVEWTTVRNEVEALMLEYSLIKQHQPRFNVRLRDDKSYPFLAVTVDEQWPRALVMRGRKRKGTRYFGPYAHAYAIRDTLDELLRSFPIRTCSPAKFRQHERLGRPCLLFHIEKCTGPCVGEIDEMPYRQLVDELCDFLDGDTEPIVKRLEPRCATPPPRSSSSGRPASATAWPPCGGRSSASRWWPTAEDLDVIGLAEDELEASVQVFYVRRGRVVGRKGFVLDKVEALSPGRPDRPHPREPVRRRPAAGRAQAGARADESDDVETYEEWLAHAARLAGADPRAPARRQAGAAGDRDPQRPGGVHPPPPAPGQRPQHAQPGAHRAAGATSSCPRRRCASSATTWPTCRAPTTSARWSCSRTGCRTSGSTAGSRCTCPATTTTRRWRRC